MRRNRLARILVVLALVVLAVATMASVRGGDPGAPAWRGSTKACRAHPMAHVHDPTRLVLEERCSTFVGRVKQVRFVPAFDDLKITLVPTAEMRRYLPDANGGVLVADVIATDQTTVSPPPVGSQVTVSGAWVKDKATKTAMMLPAYRVVVDNAGAVTIRGRSEENHGPSTPRELHLSVATE